MKKTDKDYKKYKSQPRRLALADEHDLIRAVQNGDSKAADKLLQTYDFFIISVARKVAHQTGASKNIEDLIQVGRLALYEKMFTYSFKHSSRLTSYAYREITHRMYQEACDFLEIVPLTKKFELHQAHKELDSKDFTPDAIDEVASKYNLSKNVITSLQRTTVSIEGFADSFVNYENPEDIYIERQHKNTKVADAWCSLNSAQRMVLAMLYISKSIRERTKVFGIKPKELKLIETCARRRLMAAMKEE